jgi:hypothetical protein
LPGRTQREARDAFLTPLRKALSCLTTAQLFASPAGRAGDGLEAITLSQEPLKLRSGLLGDVIYLKLRQQFRVVKDESAPARRRWKVSTVAYFYQLDDCAGAELASWHWHPQTGLRYPHTHVSGSRLGKQAHLPTGRVSIESVIRLLLIDLKVPAAKGHADDYQEILAKAEDDFIGYRSWHAHSAGRRA